MNEARPSAIIILPERDSRLAREYSTILAKAGWDVRLGTVADRPAAGSFIILGFDVAAENPALAAAVPADRLVIDFHYSSEYEEGEARPFHLLDYVTVIVHDHEAERLIREKLRSINCRTVMFPYAPEGSPVALKDIGERKIFTPDRFRGHPWLAGLSVEFVPEPFPDTVPKGSFIASPEYDVSLWPLIAWGAGGGMPLVLPAVTTFQRAFFHGALLFDPASEEDFKIKVAAMARPDFARPAKDKLKIGVVPPRYGKNAPGGAETLAAQLAENLAAKGHTAEILTTRTDSMLQWNNNLPEGAERDGAVTIRRFAVDNTDQTRFHQIGHRINRREEISWSDEAEWLRLSIRSRGMENYIKEHAAEYDYLFFIPYLYGTTYWGSHVAPEKSFLIPCYHKEPPAFTRTLRQNAQTVAGLSFNTLAEKRMAESELGVTNPASFVIGAGLNTEEKGDAARFRAKYGTNGDFLFYVGRLQREKNVPLLLDHYREYVESGKRSFGLVFAGKGDVKIKDGASGGIRNIGFVSEQDKIDGCAACFALVLPSTQESFSFVLMEAWLQGRPVLADSRCNVAREHIFACGGGLLYQGAEEFAAAVEKLRANPELATEMGRRGREYVLANFKWNVIVDRLVSTLSSADIRPLWERIGAEARESMETYRKAARAPFARWIVDTQERIAQGRAGHAVPTQDIIANVEERSDIATTYREFSNRAMIGAVLSKLRAAMTRHIQKNYIEILESKQSAFNKEAVRLLKRLYDESRGKRG
ncbi:MAG: glycosyltransferase family 4 protein [Nitrospinae bacterium]|nr:glycosyltransferase family 4 protein [Nitrospinota bacterium]